MPARKTPEKKKGTILIQEKLYKNTWRMFLIKENQYYDCLYTKKKFILIKPL